MLLRIFISLICLTLAVAVNDAAEIADANPHADCEGKSITRAREDFDHCVSNVFAESEKEESFTNSNSDANAYTFAASKKENVAFARTVRNADPNSK